MNLKHAFLGALSLAASMTASAAVLEADSFFLVYDETTALGDPTINLGLANEVNISWSLGNAVNYLNVGPGEAAPTPVVAPMPTYAIIGKPLFQLSGPVTGFAGDIVYAEVFGNVTSLNMTGVMQVDGGAPAAFDVAFAKTPLLAMGGLIEVGTYAFNPTIPVGNFSVFGFFAGAIVASSTGTELGDLPANGVSLAAIQSRAENSFEVSFFATPVPVPPAAWLFSSAVIGLVLRRRIAA